MDCHDIGKFSYKLGVAACKTAAVKFDIIF